MKAHNITRVEQERSASLLPQDPTAAGAERGHPRGVPLVFQDTKKRDGDSTRASDSETAITYYLLRARERANAPSERTYERASESETESTGEEV